MKRQWKCPECGYDKLFYGSFTWFCGKDYIGCDIKFGKKTIQALVGNMESNRLNFEAGIRTGVASARMADKITNSTSDANTVKIEPPDFNIPWDQLVKDRISAHYNNETSRCECGGEATGGTHSTWCPKGETK